MTKIELILLKWQQFQNLVRRFFKRALHACSNLGFNLNNGISCIEICQILSELRLSKMLG